MGKKHDMNYSAVKIAVEFYSRLGYAKGKKGTEHHAEHQAYL